MKSTLLFERDPKVLNRLTLELQSALGAKDWWQLPLTLKIPHPYLKPAFYSLAPKNNRSHPAITRTYRPIRMHRLQLAEPEVQRWNVDRDFRKRVWQTEIDRGYVEFDLIDGD